MSDINYKKKPHKKTGKDFKLQKQFKVLASNGTGGKTDFAFKNAMVGGIMLCLIEGVTVAMT